MCIYIYICTHTYRYLFIYMICMYAYIYIYRERERYTSFLCAKRTHTVRCPAGGFHELDLAATSGGALKFYILTRFLVF